MKRNIVIRPLLLAVAMVCMKPMLMQAQDDVYYIPSKEIRQIRNSDGELVTPTAPLAQKAECYKETRDVDDYNRRNSAVADSLVTNQPELVESTFDQTDDEAVYPYTKMVMRFHSPRPGIIISSPYYWDICYGDVWDVYYDSWAWSCPSYSWWTYAYDPWHYNRWHFRTCWDFTWGWYDPWYSHAYWGWSRPIYWGRNRPMYSYHRYGRPSWGYRDYGFGRNYMHGFGYRGGRTFARHDYGHQGYRSRGGAFGGRNFGRRVSGGPRVNRASGSRNANSYAHSTARSTERGSSRSSYGNSSTQRGQTHNYRPTRREQARDYTPARQQRTESVPSRSSSAPSYGRSRSGGFGSGGNVRSGGGGVSRSGGGGVSRGARR